MYHQLFAVRCGYFAIGGRIVQIIINVDLYFRTTIRGVLYDVFKLLVGGNRVFYRNMQYGEWSV